MRIEELRILCSPCKGSGRKAEMVHLGISQPNTDGLCRVCGGRGHTLTKLGEEMLEFLRPYAEEWQKDMPQAKAPLSQEEGK